MKKFLIALVFSFLGSSSFGATVVCVNKTALVVPIRMTFTPFGASLSAKDLSCQMGHVPYTSTTPEFKGWSLIVAAPQACLELGKALTNADIFSILIEPQVVSGQEGNGLVSVGVSDAGTKPHLVDVRCYPSPQY